MINYLLKNKHSEGGRHQNNASKAMNSVVRLFLLHSYNIFYHNFLCVHH